MADKKTLHMIGNAHIDPVWLWNWQEGFHEVKATFRSALDRMKEYADFVFVSSSAAFYEWVEQSDPEMFEEIRARIAEGRWQVVGGWWVEPDCNIPGGESFARHALIAQRYFKEKFGVTTPVGYAPDSFGHNGMLPQLLKLGGMKYYAFMRPSPHEKGLPSRLFWWESDDGSRVLTYQIPYEYCTPPREIEPHIRRVAAELQTPLNDLMCFYGVGNHGGGPTRENLDLIAKLSREESLPDLVLSTPDVFFKKMSEQNLPLPVVHDELQHHASGCYAVHSGIKRWNRQAEHALMAAEKFSSVAAAVTGQPYPGDFGRAWKNVLFNQFHDIMAGTSLESAYEDACVSNSEALSIAQRNTNLALQAIAWQIGIEAEEGMIPFVVFNPNAWETLSAVEMELGGWKPDMALLDPENRVVPYQVIQAEATCNGRTRICFVTRLPALGYAVFRLAYREGAAVVDLPKASDHVIENEALRLELDPETGWIMGLWDKRLQLEIFAGSAAKPVVIDDPSDTWSHNVFAFNREVGAFKARSVKLVEHGVVRSVLRVKSEYGMSRIMQDFILYRELDSVEVRIQVDWHEQFKLLKLRFPIHLNQMKATYEVPYGQIQRAANGIEEPGQSWVDLSGISRDNGAMYGVSILNDAKYSYDVQIRDIGLTVLRSPIYAHHIPKVADPQGDYSFIDQGMQKFTYHIYPHAGNWAEAGTVRRAWEANQKPVTLLATYHPGKLPLKQGFIQCHPAQVVVSIVKRGEDGNGWVARAYETAGRACKAKITLLERTIHAGFRAGEIKTWLIPDDAGREVVETNFLEWSE